MVDIKTLADVEQREQSGPPVLPASTYDLIRSGAQLAPEAPALSFFLRTEDHADPERWSYRQLVAAITQTANAFTQLGADKHSVIGLVLPNLPETHFAIWGAEATGIVMPVNPLLEPHTIAALLATAKVSILVTLAPFPGTDLWRKVQPILAQVPSLRHVVLVDLADRVRMPKRLAAKLLQKREVLRLHGLGGVRSAVPSTLRVHDFGRLMRAQPDDALRSGRVFSRDDDSSYYCTGGTTGTPKIARRTHKNEVFNAWSASQCFGDGIGPGKTLFCGLPLFHVNAVLVTGLVPFSLGAHVLLGTPQGYRGEGVVRRFWEIVEHHRVNTFSGVPTLFGSLLEVPIGAHRVDSLECGVCGAAPLPRQVISTFEQRTGLKIVEGYGLTEGTCVSSVNPIHGERRPGSIGLRLPGQQMKTVLLDELGVYLRDCQPDESGVIVVSGDNVFSGYLLPEQNVGLFLDLPDGRRWLNTGDLGRQDADGYFWLTGRKKELIIRGGHNIDPSSIEEPLYRHAAVLLAAAVPRPDAHAGELPVAYVQLKPDARVSEAELLGFLQSEITERAAMPRAIRLIDVMPLTAVGKIFKPSLKHLEIKDVLSTSLREAGVSLLELEVEDSARGTHVHARLGQAAHVELASSVLGQHAFVFAVTPLAD